MDKKTPTQQLLQYLHQKVWVLSKNDREYCGILKGIDEYTNIIMQDCVEYEKLTDKNFKQTKHKVILINGNTIDIIVKGERN